MLQLRTGVRLGSLRLPFKKSIESAARIGANAVEINVRSDIRPQDLTRTAVRHLGKLLSDRNLKICGLQYPTRRSFFDLEHLEQRLDATRTAMNSAFELGTKLVVGSPIRIPDADSESDQYNLLFAALSELARHGQRVGSCFAFGCGSDDGNRAAQLLQSLPPGIGIDFDPADLIVNNQSPETFLDRTGDHVLQVRARDAVRDFSQGRGIEVQLGRGSIDLPQLLGQLEEKQFDGYFVIEASGESDFEASCSNAIDYLKSLF